MFGELDATGNPRKGALFAGVSLPIDLVHFFIFSPLPRDACRHGPLRSMCRGAHGRLCYVRTIFLSRRFHLGGHPGRLHGHRLLAHHPADRIPEFGSEAIAKAAGVLQRVCVRDLSDLVPRTSLASWLGVGINGGMLVHVYCDADFPTLSAKRRLRWLHGKHISTARKRNVLLDSLGPLCPLPGRVCKLLLDISGTVDSILS